MPKIVFLSTDFVILALLFALFFYLRHALNRDELRQRWAYVMKNATALCSLTLLVAFVVVAIFDSLHFRPYLGMQNNAPVYAVKTYSLLDKIVGQASVAEEKSYSRPLATHTFEKISRLENGEVVRDYERLTAGGAHLESVTDWAKDVIVKTFIALITSGFLCSLGWASAIYYFSKKHGKSFRQEAMTLFRKRDEIPYEASLVPISIIVTFVTLAIFLWPYYHLMGTDQTGNDVLYQALKSVRTAIVIGSLATLTTLPFAIVLGICAGYFKGWIDDLIQYLYTTLSSIPSVLLIAAAVLMIQVFIDAHPGLYETGLERADLRLFMLSIIIGLTGWSTLARLLRAETLRISQLDYVQASKAFGVGHSTIMRRHIFPNIVHIVLIVAVLDFSGIVLYEAVLSYVGVGVDPTTHSFGSMINAGRLELSRSPLVWWNLCTAFVFMLALVLSANLLSSVVREAFDPRFVIKEKKG